MNANRDNGQWGNKFQELIQACQVELKKTTQIGMKMLSASQSNTILKESYEQLGMLALAAIENKELAWENEQVSELIKRIESVKAELSTLEKDVQDIKKED